MRNSFKGACYRCGDDVAAGAGHFEKANDRRLDALDMPRMWRKPRGQTQWLTQHACCAILFRGTDLSIWNRGPVKGGVETVERLVDDMAAVERGTMKDLTNQLYGETK